jgi:predicted nucleic acid-binding protein
MVAMRKLKVYLDTAVISHLAQEDAPEKMADTLKLWGMFKSGKYDIYLSDVTLNEVNACYEPKRTALFEFLSQIDYTEIAVDDEIDAVAQKFIDQGILKQKSFDDCRHIACTIVSDCDCIISWNFKHIVNVKTIKGVKIVSAITGYNEVSIYTPSFLLEGEEDND